MKREVIICDAKTGSITTEWIEDNTPEYVDYQSEIAECKERLAQTDYVVIKIAEGAATHEDYAEVIAERRALRARIGELEAKEQAQNA